MKSQLPDIQVPDEDFYSFVKKRFLLHPEDEVFADGLTAAAWTAAGVIEVAEKIASALAKRGFKRGDVACVFSVNCPEFAVVSLAVRERNMLLILLLLLLIFLLLEVHVYRTRSSGTTMRPND